MWLYFTHQSLAEQLIAAGFDISKPTVFTLEGVSQYITKEAVSSTIEELATLIQTTSATFISYVDELLDKDPKHASARVTQTQHDELKR